MMTIIMLQINDNHQEARTEKITAFDIYDECGVFEDDFENLYQNVKVRLAKARQFHQRNCTRILSGRVSLLLTLYFL